MKHPLSSKFLVSVLAVVVLSVFAVKVFAFNGPSNTAGSGVGALGLDNTNDVSVGTSSAQTGARFLVVGSTTDSSTYALKLLNGAQGAIMLVRDDGSVALGTSSFSSGYALTVNGGIYSTGNFAGNVNANNVSSGNFGANTSGGNYSFPGSVSINTSTATSLPANLTVYGTLLTTGTTTLAANGGTFSVGTTTATSTFIVNGIIESTGTSGKFIFPDGTYQSTGLDGFTGPASGGWPWNTTLGGLVLGNTAGSYNTAIGYGAMGNTTSSAAYNNVAVGGLTLQNDTTGDGNVAVGLSALDSNTSGGQNVGIGNNALDSVTTGSNNTAIGNNAGTNVTTGNQDIYIGPGAGSYQPGSSTDIFEVQAYPTTTLYANMATGFVGIDTTNPTTALYVNGTLTATTKNFEIPYPGKPGYDLVHSTLEGPEDGVYYRGEATLVNGQAVVTLPSYFDALTRAGSATVLLTAKGSTPYLLSYDNFSGNTFTVYGTLPTGTFDWQVEATRADVPLLQVVKPTPSAK